MANEVVGLILLFGSFLCLGTWPALLDLYPIHYVPSSENSVRRANYHRSICKRQLDLATSFFLVSIVPFVVTMITAEKSTDLLQTFKSYLLVLTGLGAGILMALGHLAVQWTVAVHGPVLPVSQAIQISIAVLLAAVVNYMLQPAMTSSVDFLMFGVFVLFLGTVAFSRAKHEIEKMESASKAHLQKTARSDGRKKDGKDDRQPPKAKSLEQDDTESPTEASTEFSGDPLVIRATATHIPDSQRDITCVELSMAVLSGIAFGSFPVAFNIAVNDPFEWSGARWKTSDDVLCVAQINFLFACGFWLTSIVGNLIRLNRQIGKNKKRTESPVRRALREFMCNQPTSIAEQWSSVAGIVYAFGMILQFQGGKIVGYATAELVQSWPMVYFLWIIVFSPVSTEKCCSWLNFWYFALYMTYTIGLACFVCSRLILDPF